MTAIAHPPLLPQERTTIEEIEEEDFTTEAASKYGIPSSKVYHYFWSSHYPNQRGVSRPAEDICSYCYKFHNRFRYKQRTNQQLPFTHDDPSSFVCPPISTSGATGGVVASINEVDNDEEDRVYTEDVDDNTHASEEEIMKAGEHVKMARAHKASLAASIDSNSTSPGFRSSSSERRRSGALPATTDPGCHNCHRSRTCHSHRLNSSSSSSILVVDASSSISVDAAG
jgi:hypothetical protein